MDLTTLFIVVACVSRVQCGVEVTKTWTFNWNLENRINWRGGHLECDNNVANLPYVLDYTTFVGSPVSFSSLVFPSSGELVFGEGGSISLEGTGANKAGCPHTPDTITWSHTGKDRWWDPLAWSFPDSLKENVMAVPDVHRVPCTSDVVVLPSLSKFLAPIHFEPPTVKVAGLNIEEKSYSTSGLMELAATIALGQLTGGSNPEGNVLLYSEEDSQCGNTGRDCQCHPEGNVMESVCRSRSVECPVTKCKAPVTMEGFCCPVCGADLTLPPAFTGRQSLLARQLATLSADSSMRGVSSYAGLMPDGAYHIYLVPRQDDADYAAAAVLVAKGLEDTFGKAVSSALVTTIAGATEYQRSVQASATTTTVVLVLLALLLIVAAAVFVYKRGLPRIMDSSANFQFRRMSMVAIRRLSRISLHSDTLSSRRHSVSSVAASQAGGPGATFNPQSGLRFMNPIFSKSTASLAAMPIEPEGGIQTQGPEDGSETPTSHENPMYSAYMHMTSDEKKATDYTCSSPVTKGPQKPARLDDKSQGAVRFSQLGTITEDNQSSEDMSTENEPDVGGDKTCSTERIVEMNTDPPTDQSLWYVDRPDETTIVIEELAEEESPIETKDNPSGQEMSLVDIGGNEETVQPPTVDVFDLSDGPPPLDDSVASQDQTNQAMFEIASDSPVVLGDSLLE